MAAMKNLSFILLLDANRATDAIYYPNRDVDISSCCMPGLLWIQEPIW